MKSLTTLTAGIESMSTLSQFSINDTPVSVPNLISTETSEYHVSYNNVDRWPYGSDTTALYINSTSQFLILNGDHRKGFSSSSTLEESLVYFYENIAGANVHSEHGRVFKFSGGKGEYVDGGH